MNDEKDPKKADEEVSPADPAPEPSMGKPDSCEMPTDENVENVVNSDDTIDRAEEAATTDNNAAEVEQTTSPEAQQAPQPAPAPEPQPAPQPQQAAAQQSPVPAPPVANASSTESGYVPPAQGAQQGQQQNGGNAYAPPQNQPYGGGASAAKQNDNLPGWLEPLVIRNGGIIPPGGEVGFSWAAFLFQWLYFFVRKQWKVALAIIGVGILASILSSFIPFIAPIAVIALAILSGMYGRKLAFVGAMPGKFPTNEALKKSDKPWIIVGIILIALGIIVTILVFVVFATIFAGIIGSSMY